MSFTDAVKEVYTPCNVDEIKLKTATKGLQLVFEPCGSNNFFHYGWAPSGTSLHYQTTQGLWVLKDTGENYPLRVGIPRADSAWLNDDLLAYPDAEGRQIGIYTVADHVLHLIELDHSEPEQLAHGREADEVLYLGADVPGGVKDIHSLRANTGTSDKAFSWLDSGIENFTYQRAVDSLCYRALGATEVVCARGKDGKVLRRVKDRKRGVLSVDGRYLVTEGDGKPVANFPDLQPGAEIPEYLDKETVPPALWITDMETGNELLWEGLHGTDFEWYNATPYFGSFVLWGIENRELNSNVTLVDLRNFLESKGWTPPLNRRGEQVPSKGRERAGRLD
tara:strand:- start:1068 stop:2075 length:1008 start_codon:yes stop_codon:yes gene_type:complete